MMSIRFIGSMLTKFIVTTVVLFMVRLYPIIMAAVVGIMSLLALGGAVTTKFALVFITVLALAQNVVIVAENLSG